MRSALAAALCASLATAAFGSPDDAPPRVELPGGPYVRPGRPVDVRVIGGADRVRAPGTPWALPVGARGDEFLLQMPAAVAAPLELTVEGSGRTDRVTVAVTVLPADGTVVALLGDAVAPAGATGIRLRTPDPPPLEQAWLQFDDVVGDRTSLRGGSGLAFRSAWPADPLLRGPDPELFAAAEEAAAASPLLEPGASTLLLLLGATEVTLALALAFRRDRPWIRAAWLSIPAAAAVLALGDGLAGPSLVAVPIAVQGNIKVVYVRVHALRDGTGTLTLPTYALGPAAVIRYSADDRSVEEVQAGREVRLTLRAGESRVFGYATIWDKPHLTFVPGTGAPSTTPGPAILRWLAREGLGPDLALAGVHPRSRPVSSEVRILPGIEVFAVRPPVK